MLPENITEISMSTFSRCTSLVSVGLPSGLEKIGSLAFYGCTSLEEVTIPRFVEVIEGGAFYGCSKLKNVEMLSPVPPSTVAENAFSNVAANAVVHVPAGSWIAYRDQIGSSGESLWCGLLIDDPQSAPFLSDGFAVREDDTTAVVSFTVDLLSEDFIFDTTYYYAVVDDGAPQPVINTSGAGITASSLCGRIRVTDLTAGARDIYIAAKYDGRLSNTLKVDIGVYTRPFSVVIENHQAGALAREIEDYLNSSGHPGAYDKIKSLKVKGGVVDAADQDYLSSGHVRRNWRIEKIDLSETSFEYYAASDNAMKEGLFAEASYVTVILPKGLTAVSDRAFYGCRYLAEVSITESVTGLTRIGYLLIDKDGNLSARLVSDYEKKDADITAYIDGLKAEFEQKLSQTVAVVRNDLITHDPVTNVRIIRRAETNLGDLCADAIRAATKADIAVMNGGGIRAGIKSGEVTYGDVYSVYPFGNRLCTIKVTGQQLLDALEFSVSAFPDENGGFLHVSGLTFTFRTDIPSPVTRDDSGMFTGVSGERRVQSVMVGDRPLDPDKTYILAGIDYILRDSGDGYSMFAGCPVVDADVGLDFDVLVDFLTYDYQKDPSLYEEVYGDGRISAVQ